MAGRCLAELRHSYWNTLANQGVYWAFMAVQNDLVHFAQTDSNGYRESRNGVDLESRLWESRNGVDWEIQIDMERYKDLK